jgi:RimJ/RimL family protein N-acetyltransferase
MAEPQIDLGQGYALRSLRAGDDADLAHWLGNGEVASFLPFLPQPYGLIEAHAWIAHRLRFRERQGHETYFAICDPKSRLIGAVALDDFRIGHTHDAELGYWLELGSRDRGLGTRAVAAFVRYAFAELSLERISARTLVTNQRSAALLRRVGFHEEGRRLKYVRVGSDLLDVQLFGLLRASLAL